MVLKIQSGSPIPNAALDSSAASHHQPPQPKDTITETPPSCLYSLYVSVWKFLVQICSCFSKTETKLNLPVLKEPTLRAIKKQAPIKLSAGMNLDKLGSMDLGMLNAALNRHSVEKNLLELQMKSPSVLEFTIVLAIDLPMFQVLFNDLEAVLPLTIYKSLDSVKEFQAEIQATRKFFEKNTHCTCWDHIISYIDTKEENESLSKFCELKIRSKCKTLKAVQTYLKNKITMPSKQTSLQNQQDAISDLSAMLGNLNMSGTENDPPTQNQSFHMPNNIPEESQKTLQNLFAAIPQTPSPSQTQQPSPYFSPSIHRLAQSENTPLSKAVHKSYPPPSPLAKVCESKQKLKILSEELFEHANQHQFEEIYEQMDEEQKRLFLGLFFEIPWAQVQEGINPAINALNIMTYSKKEHQKYFIEVMHSFNEIVRQNLIKENLFAVCEEAIDQGKPFSDHCPSLQLICKKLKKNSTT